MDRLYRRDALGAIGGGIALSAFGGTATAAGKRGPGCWRRGSKEGRFETLLSVPGERVPENLAVGADGTLYFGITAGSVWALSPDQTQESDLSLDDAERVASLPGSAIGVEVGPDGALYVASQSEEGTGVWTVPDDGGDPELFAAIAGFPNGVLHDAARDRLLVTESFGGAVYEVPLDAADAASAASLWSDDDLLATDSFGANGLTLAAGAAFVTVTRGTDDGEDVGRVVRVPVERDGSAGEAESHVAGPEVYGADGITSRGPHLYLAANERDEVVRIGPSKRTKVVASGEDGLTFPSDVAFGTAPRTRGDLFVCNFARDTPAEGAIFRTHP